MKKLTNEEVNLIRALLRMDIDWKEKERASAALAVVHDKEKGRDEAWVTEAEEYLQYKKEELAFAKETAEHFEELMEQIAKKGGKHD